MQIEFPCIWMAFTRVGLNRSAEASVGAEELHDLQLLRRQEEIPTRIPTRMHPILEDYSYSSVITIFIFLCIILLCLMIFVC